MELQAVVLAPETMQDPSSWDLGWKGRAELAVRLRCWMRAHSEER